MENGPFSDDRVVEAAKSFITVYLDGDKPSTRPIERKYKVPGYPTIIFMKPNGDLIKKFVGPRALSDIEFAREEIGRIFKKYAKEVASVTWVDSLEEAVEEADEELIFVFFANDKKGSRRMKEITLKNLRVMKKLGEGFICLEVEFDRKSDLAKKYRVTSAPTMLVLDGEGKKISLKTGAKKPREAISFLEKALKTAQKKKKAAY